MLYFFFFFSSRRRHTRWPRDWSSDVCSSDLTDISQRKCLCWPRCSKFCSRKMERPESATKVPEAGRRIRSEEHTSELQSRGHLVCRLLLEKKKHDEGSLRKLRVNPIKNGTIIDHISQCNEQKV